MKEKGSPNRTALVSVHRKPMQDPAKTSKQVYILPNTTTETLRGEK